MLGVKDLVANRICDRERNFIGKLEDILIDARTGCIRHAVVAVGGVMGVGRRRLAIPWSVLTPKIGEGRCIVDVAQMLFTAARPLEGGSSPQSSKDAPPRTGLAAASPGSRPD
jgi:sporulation protein YlmC with PRC-barrel domain